MDEQPSVQPIAIEYHPTPTLSGNAGLAARGFIGLVAHVCSSVSFAFTVSFPVFFRVEEHLNCVLLRFLRQRGGPVRRCGIRLRREG
jgi:hypothetical protein